MKKSGGETCRYGKMEKNVNEEEETNKRPEPVAITPVSFALLASHAVPSGVVLLFV